MKNWIKYKLNNGIMTRSCTHCGATCCIRDKAVIHEPGCPVLTEDVCEHMRIINGKSLCLFENGQCREIVDAGIPGWCPK